MEVTSSTPDRMAIWAPGHNPVSFIELRRLAASAQALCRECGVGPGDTVLIMDRPGPRLFASLIGTVATGACPILVEPWISIGRVEALIEELHPKAFFASTLGKVLLLRLPAIRAIPNKINPRTLNQDTRGSALDLAEVQASSPALITFTSSVDAPSRAIERKHGALRAQLEALSSALESHLSDGTHLSLFTNTTLSHLLAGKTSLVMPQRWSRSAIRAIEALPQALAPISLHCSPGFLARLMELKAPPTIRRVYLSRAIADCSLLEAAFARWPDTNFRFLYGSSESEPLTSIDARETVRLSRERGFIQTVALGQPLPKVRLKPSPEGASAEAPHLGGWCALGDRVTADASGWWYQGRTSVTLEEFQLEQQVYRFLNSTHCFIHRDPAGKLHLVGESIKKSEEAIHKEFPAIASIVETPIFRDRRHQSWINRRKTLRGGASWLLEGPS